MFDYSIIQQVPRLQRPAARPQVRLPPPRPVQSDRAAAGAHGLGRPRAKRVMVFSTQKQSILRQCKVTVNLK